MRVSERETDRERERDLKICAKCIEYEINEEYEREI